MSSSTAAITATPAVNNGASLAFDSNSKPSARRRQLALAEKKNSTVEKVFADGEMSGAGQERVSANGKDLIHTIRGETVLERPRDSSRSKKGLVGSTISPRRHRSTPKPEKSTWQTLSVLLRNLTLLAVLVLMGQMIWKGAYYRLGGSSSSSSSHAAFAPLDFEGRISEVERTLKTASKMMQVQLDVMDKKISSEIWSARKGLMKQHEDNSALLEGQLKNLESRIDWLDKSLGELRDSGLFSKAEFNKFLDELKKSREGNNDKDLSLDDVRVYAREIVEKEIERHASDGLGRIDYALGSGGGRVVRHSEPYGFGKANGWFLAAQGRYTVHKNAQKMLEPSFGEPGQCFPLVGNYGFVEIKLRAGILPDAVTLEHVSKSVAYDRSSAPKDCRVSAWFEGPDDDRSIRPEKQFLLTEFTYDLEKSNAQTFNIGTADSGVVNMVRFDFTSNHGSDSHTCIYRLRVHGYEPSSFTEMTI